MTDRIPKAIRRRAHRLLRWPPVGMVRFGSLRRRAPISEEFGFDRGNPVDRVYIEDFLLRHRADVRGHVLEIKEDLYASKLGGHSVERVDILDIDPSNPHATVIADLAEAASIPADSYDAIICTQTLSLIYEVRSAVGHLRRILKPGGVLLLTDLGIARSTGGAEGLTYWKFTRHSVERLCGDAFSPENVETEAMGNVYTAVASLHGLASEDIRQRWIEPHDPLYEVIIAARAVKPGR